jgi:hypothetical protein
MVELYLHFPIILHGVVLSYLSVGATVPFIKHGRYSIPRYSCNSAVPLHTDVKRKRV